MLSFRKKILFSDLILFLVLIAFLFPFVEKTVGNIVRRSLEENARELIDLVDKAPNVQGMIEILKSQELYYFFRASLINPEGHVLYDSHAEKLLKEEYSPYYIVEHPEVEEALKTGVGYSEGYSRLFGQTFAYLAVAFEFHGQKFVLRTAFPFRQIEDLTKDFEIGFLSLGAVILLLYSVMTWAILHRLSRPIQYIITAIKPYQEGKEEFLPHIEMGKMIDPNDDFGKLAKTLNSLTERIQIQIQTLTQQRNENEGILESLVEGVTALDAKNNITFANSMAGKMLGSSKSSLVGKSLSDLAEEKPSVLVEKCIELVGQCQRKAEILIDSLMLGQLHKIFIDVIAIPKVHMSGAILVLQDKTSDYKVVEMGKDFIANASHELRTPLTVVRGFAETLQDIPQLSPEMLKDITDKIVRTCERLDKLIKNLLTLADIENLYEARTQKCDLITLLENCTHVLQYTNPEAKVTIKNKSDSVFIGADFDLMELAIMNILENAVKYSNPPAEINIKVQQWGDEVELNIADNGIGIPEADLEHVFERFYRVDKARSRKFGGAGLGLSLVKTVIDKHHGNISVTSEVGKGSCFKIFLPSFVARH